MKQPSYTSRVTAVRDVTPGVRELTLSAPPGGVEFEPGQWISLHLPVGEHPPLVRAYSLAAAPDRSGELVLCFDRVPEGLGSQYLFALQPGDEIRWDGPLGRFTLPETETDLLWLARYTGIVPFRAMLQHLRGHPPAGRVALAYSAPAAADLAYLDELRTAAAECPWFELYPFVDAPDTEPDLRVGSALDWLPGYLEGRGRVVPMICGKREFVRPLRDFFHARGYERREVKWESYD